MLESLSWKKLMHWFSIHFMENLALAGDTAVPVYETLKQQRYGDEVRVCTKQKEYELSLICYPTELDNFINFIPFLLLHNSLTINLEAQSNMYFYFPVLQVRSPVQLDSMLGISQSQNQGIGCLGSCLEHQAKLYFQPHLG